MKLDSAFKAEGQCLFEAGQNSAYCVFRALVHVSPNTFRCDQMHNSACFDFAFTIFLFVRKPGA